MKKWIKMPSNAFSVILFIFLLLFPVFQSQQFIINSFCLVFLYAYWASSWNILGGYAGQTSLGHASFVGLGAYVTTILFMEFNCSPWFGLLVAGFVAGLARWLSASPASGSKDLILRFDSRAVPRVPHRLQYQQYAVRVHHRRGAGVEAQLKGGLQWLQFLDKRGYYYIILRCCCSCCWSRILSRVPRWDFIWRPSARTRTQRNHWASMCCK